MKNVFIFSLTGGKSALAKDEPLLWPKHKMIPNGLSDKGEDIMQNGIDVANVNGAVDWQDVYKRQVWEKEGIHTAVCDYISGMSDRFAIHLYTELFVPKSWQGISE